MFARHIRNRRIGDAIDRWAFASLGGSPGARAFYDRQRDSGKTHGQALRALGNKLIGQLYGCLDHGTLYDEGFAWRISQRASPLDILGPEVSHPSSP
ncbi:hypothetical protein FTX61_01025 [Nitriliruptoraceae bacterium ZYF776]|nr:hypothetical protein [Profundirhabdus halotolerans]